MGAGKLDTRIGVYRLNQTVDGYGGFSDSPTLLTTLWANVTYLSGEMKTENGCPYATILAPSSELSANMLPSTPSTKDVLSRFGIMGVKSAMV